jgi:hypothetical protein
MNEIEMKKILDEIRELKKKNEILQNELMKKKDSSNLRKSFIEMNEIDSEKYQFSKDEIIHQFQMKNRDESFNSLMKMMRLINSYQYHEIFQYFRENFKISDSDSIESMKKISHSKI